MDLETMRQAIEDHELEEAQRLVVELRRMVVKLDLAIANYQDAFAQLQGVSETRTVLTPRAGTVQVPHNPEAA